MFSFLVNLRLEFGEFILYLLPALLRCLVFFLCQSLDLDLELDNFPFNLVNLRGDAVDLHSQPRRSFVDKVDCLVRQKPVRNVAMRKGGRGYNGRVFNADLVMELIFFLQTPEDGDRLLDTRLADIYRLETSLEGSIFFYIFAKFVEGCGADAAQLSACQGGFQHIRRINRSLGASGAYDRVEFVNEKNDGARCFIDFFQNRLQPVLKFSAEFCPGKQRPQIEGKHPFVFKGFGDIPRYDSLGKPFNDGCLSDPRFADDDGIILCPAGQDLHDPADLFIAADHRIKLSFSGFFRQVAAVSLKRLVFLFRCLVGHALGSPDVFENGVNAVLRNAVRAQYGRSRRILCIADADEHMFGTDIFILEPVRFGKSNIKGLFQVRGNVCLALPPSTRGIFLSSWSRSLVIISGLAPSFSRIGRIIPSFCDMRASRRCSFSML